MTRRAFITLLGGAAAWPLAARAQQPRLPTVALLGATTAAAQSQWTAAFSHRLQELGWIEGRTVSIEYRWVEGRTERYAQIATELVQRKVDVIVTSGAAVAAIKQATSIIPIVFAVAGDPLGSGLVVSLSRPGGNVTGLSLQQADLGAKRIELLREVLPTVRTLGVLFNENYSASLAEMKEAQSAARTLGLYAEPVAIRRAQDIAPAIEGLKSRAEALYVVSEPLVSANRLRINILALGARLPTVHGFREYVELGGLMSYGPSLTDLWRRAAGFVDKILRGATPADLPVEQPTKFDLVFNLTVAKALGLEVPPTVLARADEVIE